ncbi:MAG: hypothetical protein FJ267_13260 [Planctomycetes bacterium]|nr:hypothetical protein [Planctomycetota bacterium]
MGVVAGTAHWVLQTTTPAPFLNHAQKTNSIPSDKSHTAKFLIGFTDPQAGNLPDSENSTLSEDQNKFSFENRHLLPITVLKFAR